MSVTLAQTAGVPLGTFYLFATALAVGVILGLPLVPIREIGRKFFILMSLIAIVFYALSLVGGEWLSYFHLAAAGLLIAYNVSVPPSGGTASLVVLLLAIACGLAGLVDDARTFGRPVPVSGSQAMWLAISFVSSAALLGGALVSMVLGHWYLVARGLSFSALRNTTVLLLAALLLRLATIVVLGVLQRDHWSTLWMEGGGGVTFLSSIGIFVGARALFGLLLPLGLAWMVWQCVKIRSNQSATGILYVLLAFVLIGEIIAKHLLVGNAVLI